MNFSLLENQNIEKIEAALLKNGQLQIYPAEFYERFTFNELKVFCFIYGIYQIPTLELIEFLKKEIVGTAIEIGSGNGVLGRWLGIPATDSRMQEFPDVKPVYDLMKQPTVQYGDNIIKLEALEAVNQFNPDTVIGSWITQYDPTSKIGNPYGVRENEILKKVDKYIMIGNVNTHYNKDIMFKPHRKLFFPWLISRAANQRLNVIYIWEK